MILRRIIFFTYLIANFLQAMHEIPLTPKTPRAFPAKILAPVLPSTHSQPLYKPKTNSDFDLDALIAANSYVYDKDKKVMVPLAQQSTTKSSTPVLPLTHSQPVLETKKTPEFNLKALIAANKYVYYKNKKKGVPLVQQSTTKSSAPILRATDSQPLLETKEASELYFNALIAANKHVYDKNTKKRSTPYLPQLPQPNFIRTKTFHSTEERTNTITYDCDSSVVSVMPSEDNKALVPQTIPLTLTNKQYIVLAALKQNKKIVNIIYSSKSKHKNKLFYSNSNNKRFSLKHEDTVRKFGHKFNADCNLLLTIAGKFLYIWDLKTKTLRASWLPYDIKSSVNNVNFDASGNYVMSTCTNGHINIWESATGKELHSYKIEGEPESVLIENNSFNTPFERILVYKYSKNEYPMNQLCMYLTSSGTEQKFWGTPHTNNIQQMALSNNGKFVVTCSWDNTTKIWAITPHLPGHQLQHTIRNRSNVNALAISNNSAYIAIALINLNVFLYDCVTGKHILTPRTDQESYLRGLQFSADDTTLFGHTENVLLLWNLSALTKTA